MSVDSPKTGLGRYDDTCKRTLLNPHILCLNGDIGIQPHPVKENEDPNLS